MNFKEGFKDGIPIGLGYLSVSFAFGIFCVSNGLNILQAVLISLTNLTSAGQLAGVPIIVSGGSLIEIAVTQLVINSRYLLMSVILSQKYDHHFKLVDKLIVGFAITDEIFGVSSSKNYKINKSYSYALMIAPIIGWVSGTFLGALVGDILPQAVSDCLTIMIYGMFIAIVVPVCKNEKNVFICCLIALTLSCIFHYVPFLKQISSGFIIIICSVVSSFIMAIISPIKENNDEA